VTLSPGTSRDKRDIVTPGWVWVIPSRAASIAERDSVTQNLENGATLSQGIFWADLYGHDLAVRASIRAGLGSTQACPPRYAR